MLSKTPLWLKLTLCILLTLLIGGAGGYITVSEIPGWYAGLKKPPGNPPNWVFGPVWSVLYTLMGISFALIWHAKGPASARKKGMILFGIQFLLNIIWTPVFFGMHRPGSSLIIIIGMWILIALTIRQFAQVRKASAWMLAPYLCWVSYATYLNAAIFALNR